MCTLTIVPCADGFRATCNRDERNTRAVALPPRVHRLRVRVALFPVDPQSGGTWVGVNDAGLALTLLNRTCGDRGSATRGAPLSRGLIIPPLLEHDRLSDALRMAEALDAAAFEPFRLVAVQGSSVGVVASDGCRVSLETSMLRRPQLFTSSSLGDSLVEAPRRRLFERMVLDAVDGALDGQFRFHRHHWPRRPAISVRMARAGARTVSRSVIDVRARRIALQYEPLDEPAGAV